MELKVKKRQLLIKYSLKKKKKIFPVKIERLLGTQMFFNNNKDLSFLGKSKVILALKDDVFFIKKSRESIFKMNLHR